VRSFVTAIKVGAERENDGVQRCTSAPTTAPYRGGGAVLTSPEFSWAVELLQYWGAEGRKLFSPADRSPALWPGERGGRMTLNALTVVHVVSPAGRLDRFGRLTGFD
jgi:hypothetical protein